MKHKIESKYFHISQYNGIRFWCECGENVMQHVSNGDSEKIKCDKCGRMYRLYLIEDKKKARNDENKD